MYTYSMFFINDIFLPAKYWILHSAVGHLTTNDFEIIIFLLIQIGLCQISNVYVFSLTELNVSFICIVVKLHISEKFHF